MRASYRLQVGVRLKSCEHGVKVGSKVGAKVELTIKLARVAGDALFRRPVSYRRLDLLLGISWVVRPVSDAGQAHS